MFEMFGGRLNSGRMRESIRKVVSWSVKLQRVCFQIEDSPTVCLTIILEVEEARSRYSWGQIGNGKRIVHEDQLITELTE